MTAKQRSTQLRAIKNWQSNQVGSPGRLNMPELPKGNRRIRTIRIAGKKGNLSVLVAASSGRGEINTYKIAAKTTLNNTSLAQ